MTDGRTLEIRVEPTERTRAEVREKVRALERGEPVESEFVLTFEDEADLVRLVTEPNLELLRVIARHEPGSMRETADLVDRDFKEVHRNLTELEAMNVIELREEGRAKRPVMRYDALDVRIPLGTDEEESDSVLA
jgi:predicted transcriptional regulator